MKNNFHKKVARAALPDYVGFCKCDKTARCNKQMVNQIVRRKLNRFEYIDFMNE